MNSIKLRTPPILIILFASTLIMLAQISNIFIANFIFYILLLFYGIKVNNKNCVQFYLLFIITFMLSTLHYMFIVQGSIRSRWFVTAIFTIQYFMLVVDVKIPVRTFEKWFKRISVIYALVIIVAFVRVVDLSSPVLFYIHNRMWGSEMFNGWPNGTAIPLIFSLFLFFDNGEKIMSRPFEKTTLIVASILTTSRTALIGCVLVGVYFVLVPHGERIVSYIKKRFLLFVVGGILLICVYTWLVGQNDLLERMLFSDDRDEILTVTKELLMHSPLLGFGGETLGDLLTSYGISTSIPYTHAHNFILETLIRYGLIGLLFFLLLLVGRYKRIRSQNNRAMFIIMWFMALFQIYGRNFVFLYLVAYVCYRDDYLMNERRELSYRKYEQ